MNFIQNLKGKLKTIQKKSDTINIALIESLLDSFEHTPSNINTSLQYITYIHPLSGVPRWQILSIILKQCLKQFASNSKRESIELLLQKHITKSNTFNKKDRINGLLSQVRSDIFQEPLTNYQKNAIIVLEKLFPSLEKTYKDLNHAGIAELQNISITTRKLSPEVSELLKLCSLTFRAFALINHKQPLKQTSKPL